MPRLDVSIIVPVYNVENYVRRCMESVIAQETDALSMECIVLNDCTKDASMDIVREIVAGYSGSINFRLVDNPRNVGLSATRNLGVNMALGEYLLFLDSDDHMPPRSIERLWRAYQQYPEAGLVVGNALQCKNGQMHHGDITEPVVISDTLVACQKLLRMELPVQAWNKLVRASDLKRLGVTFAEGYIYEDVCWTYSLYSRLSPLVFLPDVTYIYEDNAESIVNTVPQKADLTLRSYLLICNTLMDKAQKGVLADIAAYVFLFLMRCLDIVRNYDVPKDTKVSLRATRRRLMAFMLRHKCLVLGGVGVLLYPPFVVLLHSRYYRSHLDFLARFARKLSL